MKYQIYRGDRLISVRALYPQTIRHLRDKGYRLIPVRGESR